MVATSDDAADHGEILSCSLITWWCSRCWGSLCSIQVYDADEDEPSVSHHHQRLRAPDTRLAIDRVG
eukprot:12873-Eustigmatos_ZCMA.PRE.1